LRKIIALFMMLQLVPAPISGVAQASEFDKYEVISNEAINSSSTESTGVFNVKNINKSLKSGTYQVDFNRPFDAANNNGKQVQKRTLFSMSTYSVGDSKYFWVSNLTDNSNYQINATLAYSGTKANVWVNNNQITDADAVKLGKEFDNRIYPSVTNNFGTESDVDHNGKINILCYDIQDGFADSGAYVGGYFWAGDLYNTSYSNQSEIFYMDTYPSMGLSSTKDVTQAYSTLAHEFQHMVNFNQNVLIEGHQEMDTWLNEGLSMAAEQIYSGQGLSDRVDYYNTSSSIQNGHSLLYWDDSGDVLSNYSLSYLFLQYIKLQAGQGNQIFKEILKDPNSDYKAIEDVAKKYISPDMTFGKLMTDFRIALLLKESTGLYGFKGDPFFNSIKTPIYTGNSISLRGGGAVVTTASGLVVPPDKGADITYTTVDVNGDHTPPDAPIVNQVTDQDTTVSGTTEPNAEVTVKVGGNVIGTDTANDNGDFNVTIPSQKGGTVLVLTAADQAGNVSDPQSITVKDVTAPSAPVINEVTDHETVLTGTAEPGSIVTAKVSGFEIGHGTADGNGKFSITIPLQPSGKIIEVYSTDSSNNVSTAGKVTVTAKLQALIGATRYSTAVKVSQTGWDTAKTVLLVNGEAIVDGLTATPLASAKDAPMLLTRADAVPDETLNELKRLQAKEIILIGGTGVISTKVEASLISQGFAVTRLGGKTRYETSLLIAKSLDNITDVKTAFMAYGWGEPDALSIAAQAGMQKQPIILTDKNAVPAETLSWLKSEGISNAYFIGGTGVIAPSIINVINNITSQDVSHNRISGADRLETNAKVISKFYPGTDFPTILIAKSETPSLVDALTAGPLAAKMGAPVLLCSQSGIQPSQQTILSTKHFNHVHQIGVGISSTVVNQVVK
jgi:putative cell wall-binding protein